MSKIKDFIDSVTTGSKTNTRDILDQIISEKAIDALEFKKVEIAKGLFNPVNEEEKK